jgi:hypothetical protein
MPRGRPRKVPLVEEPEPTTVQQIIAKEISNHCQIPGCIGKFHLEDASSVIDSLKKAGFEIVKASSS